MKLTLDDVQRLLTWGLNSKKAASQIDAALLRRLRQESQLLEVGLGYTETIVTPRVAKQWLLNSMPLKHLSQQMIDRYAVAMRNGEWHMESREPLRFDSSGRLVDGQHRLHACVQANRAFPAAIVHQTSDNTAWSQTQARNLMIAEQTAERVTKLPKPEAEDEILRALYRALAEHATAA